MKIQQTNQNGRTMIEMLGVLAVVGVIAVGGFHIVAKALKNQRTTQIMADAAELVTNAKKLACDYDTGYSSYSQYLYRSEAYPANLFYDASEDQYTGSDDVKYAISADVVSSGSNISEDYFILKISGLSEEQCQRMAIDNWGHKRTTGCVGISINATVSGHTPAYSSDDADNYPVSPAVATEKCNQGSANDITLIYVGCRY